MKSLSGHTSSTFTGIFLLAVIYYATSKLGFAMAFTAEQVTAVWPPTGIALAALLLFGYRLWPGIILGAFLTNITTNEPVATACGIAIGNTLEAIAGAWMLKRVGFHNDLSRLRDVLSLFVCSALISTALSATIGVTSLCLGGVQPWSVFASLWLIWWVGDATGALLVAPALLVWGTRAPPMMFSRRVVEAIALTGGLMLTCGSIFLQWPFAHTPSHFFIYPAFLFTIWAALRFGQRVTTLVALLCSAIAIWATVQNVGPFNDVSIGQTLLALQMFMGVVAVTGLLLSAAISERKETEGELKESDRRKSEFLATLAHELRNPLAPLSNALSLVQLAESNPPQRGEALAIMRRQVQQMTRLIDDLLDVSRIEHGKIELRKDIISFQAAIHNAIEVARPLIEAYSHTLSVDLPKEPLWLNADPTRLSQIFGNLLNNAAKYTKPGGKICMAATVEEGAVIVKIRDTGIGIPPDMLTKIFNIFTQVDNSIERAQGGLGIGLTLVRTLVKMHDGTVVAQSAGVNQGSEFIVRLPLAAAPAVSKALASAPSNQPATTQKFRVLVVDDNQNLAKTLGWMVELLGHEVRVAHDGPAAFSVAKTFLPEVILLDIGLSGMSGYDVCTAMRAEPALKNSIFIAQTGWGQPEHRQRSKQVGFAYHLVKPVEIETLERLLKSLILPVTVA